MDKRNYGGVLERTREADAAFTKAKELVYDG